jgi:AMP nucleosidase
VRLSFFAIFARAGPFFERISSRFVHPLPSKDASILISKRCSLRAKSYASNDRCATCSTHLISPPMDDAIANGTLQRHPGTPEPLALFRAARVDYSLHRLFHYTGTDPEHFQNFVIFTNYQFYVDAFRRLGHEHMASGRSGAEVFVEPGSVITRNARLGGGTSGGGVPQRMPQMPAFHLVEPGYRGITMINIGTGPSNARTITDHVAVLRPHAWLMLGHCAGLSNSQNLGDYVLAHGYMREDHVLDNELPVWAPIPALAEMQVALANVRRPLAR